MRLSRFAAIVEALRDLQQQVWQFQTESLKGSSRKKMTFQQLNTEAGDLGHVGAPSKYGAPRVNADVHQGTTGRPVSH